MKKRRLHQNLHPFDVLPFEVFSRGSWKPVLYLQISGGTISTQVDDEGDVIKENVQISNLRIRSRKATLSDCICFLRPGFHVSVLSTPQESEDSFKKEILKPVWLDAKIKTIERKIHETGCECQFYVSFYNAQKENIIAVKINQISVLQRLDRSPCENKYFRWDNSLDCTTLQQSQLFPGKFASDLSWAVVVSLHKEMSFDIKLIQKKIVYQIFEYDSSEIFLISHDQVVALNFKIENGISVPVVFAFNPSDVVAKEINCYGDEDGNTSIYYLLGLRRSKRRNVEPDRYIDCSGIYSKKTQNERYKKGQWDYEEISDNYVHDLERQLENDESQALLSGERSVNNFEELRRKTISMEKTSVHNRIAQPRRVVPMFNEKDQVILEDLGDTNNYLEDGDFENFAESQSRTTSREKLIVPNQNSKSPNLASEITEQSHSNKTFSKFSHTTNRAPCHIDEIAEVFATNAKRDSRSNVTNAKSDSRSNVTNVKSYSKSRRSNKYFQTRRYSSMYLPDGNFRRLGTSRYKSFSASVFKKMMEKCVENIENTIGKEQPLAIDQWIEIRANIPLYRCDHSESSEADDEDKSELDLLWNEMDLCLVSTYLIDDNEASGAEVPQSTNKESGRVCEHEFKLNEEIGILCQLCGHVETEIKDIMPKFLERSRWNYGKGEFYEGDFDYNQDVRSRIDLFSLNTASNIPLSESEDNVWALIPELRGKLQFHQKKAFEFLWRNISGTLIPAHMQVMAKKKGGCVISHSPGAGKTLLVIAFLESYLKLFPGSRPLVLAPKTTLYAWYKEITKWDVSIPVYRIHSGRKSKCEASTVCRKSFNRDYTHILDCLEKIQKWVSDPSVLIMGYPSFLTLTRGHTNCSYKQYMARILKKYPGILILDEGHNPRATRSGLRKALMRVETKLRVLLSGTLFQNNFGEYFNTLALARPGFIDEVLTELDPDLKRRKRNTGLQTRLSLENRARRVFNDGIAKKINDEKSDERARGLNMLRKLTSGFIDVYEGGSDNLPGLHCYTLMMKSTPLQQELLVKLQNQKPRHSGFPLELGALITLGSIHPWLIQTAPYATQHFTSKELESLEKCKSDFKLGPKVRFVMSLLPRCIIKNEKVLIFCFNIAPIKFFVEIFETVFGWKNGDDVLVITGDLELFERGRIMDRFEEKGTNSKVMLASISACGEGVSLTAASRLILLDSQWNPSKTKQAIARAFRPGQQKVVYVYQLLASGTLEEDKYVKTTWKEWVSSLIFSEEIAEDPSKIKAEKIEDDVLKEIVKEDGTSLFNMIIKNNEKASNGVVRSK